MAKPYMTAYTRSRDMTTRLRGLNLTDAMGDGEWSDTQNLTSLHAPVIRQREKRIRVAQLAKPNGIFATDKLCFVDGVKFYYNGYYYGDVADSKKQMAAMGAKICIFPDKVVFDTGTYTFTPMERQNVTSGTVNVTLAKADGTKYTGVTTSATEPESPQNGALWLDTSGSEPIMKQWSEATGMWVEQSTTYVLVEATGIGQGLKQDDAVNVKGLTQESLNGDWILAGAGDDQILYTGILASVITQTAAVTVKRTVPDMDYIVEHNNRLWGCSSLEHEIYCCALGDPTNWRRYAGLSTDSYAVTVGTAGDFTGAAVVGTAVVFAKENCLHRIYGTQPSNFQMTVDKVRGAEKGSGGAMILVDGTLYYKSVFDVCGFDAGEAVSVSGALDGARYHGAVAGALDRVLYLSMQDDQDAWHLLTYNTANGLWMREDSTHAIGFASLLTETFLLDAEGGVWALSAGAYAKDACMVGSDYVVKAEEEASVSWEAVTGEMLQSLPDNKFVSRVQVLLELGQGAAADLYTSVDGGDWVKAVSITAVGRRRYTLPIYPKRCDTMKLKISGSGDVKIINIGKLIQTGSELRRGTT